MRNRMLCVCVSMVMAIILLPVHVFAVNFDVEKIYPSVVVVYSGNSVGSGFAVDTHRIITNAHVLDSADIVVQTYAGDRYVASIESINTDLDIAILFVALTSFVALPRANLDVVNIGDDVYAIGAPNAMAYTLTRGIVSAKRDIRGVRYLQTDAAINKGNSGGPLLNHLGELLGVNTLKLADSEGISLALPVTVVDEYIKQFDSNNHTEIKGANNLPEGDTLAHKSSVLVQNLTLVVAMCVSVLLNIALVIYNYTLRKNVNSYNQNIARRTDFDIEIIE